MSLEAVAHILTLSAIIALHFAPVSWLRAIPTEVTDLVTIAACGISWILRLVAILRHVAFLTTESQRQLVLEEQPYDLPTVAACPAPTASWAVFGEMADC